MSNQRVTIIARTVEKPVDSLIKNNVSFEPDDMREEALILSGKAAGVCYMPDTYLSNGIQDDEKALKRVKGNAKSGHYSVFEHSHFTFLVETNKAMAMVLNSTKLYSTSEKSARYTTMNPETEIEKKMYNKWASKLKDIINKTYPGEYTEKEVEKLALENARYFLSVFTPTVMIYTLPFNRVILLCEWLDKMVATIREMFINDIFENDNTNRAFFSRLSVEAEDLAEQFRKTLNLSKEEPIIVDHKDIGINLFNSLYYYERKDLISLRDSKSDVKNIMHSPNIDFLKNDIYSSNCFYSFACLAQEQRHRTLTYTISSILENYFYTPKILDTTELINEWNKDMVEVSKNNIVPQATMLFVRESGSFDNFFLKCKERLCMRAQKEIFDVTASQIANMYHQVSSEDIRMNTYESLSPLNRARLLSMYYQLDNPHYLSLMPRCMWPGYTCKEPCNHMIFNCVTTRLI